MKTPGNRGSERDDGIAQGAPSHEGRAGAGPWPPGSLSSAPLSWAEFPKSLSSRSPCTRFSFATTHLWVELCPQKRYVEILTLSTLFRNRVCADVIKFKMRTLGWPLSTVTRVLIRRGKFGDFPGGPVGKTPHSQCRGPGSIPGQGTRSHMHAATKGPARNN